MLFNSYAFIFAFLPVTFGLFYGLGQAGRTAWALYALVACSLFFYGWWNPVYLWLIGASIGFNFALGRRLERCGGSGGLLGFGILVNLAALGYFKYANFFVDNLNLLLAEPLTLPPVVLPLAISFFTFQQIAYLVDAHRGLTREHSFLHYCLFVTFFPQLIAGPIVHHKEMLPQFAHARTYRIQPSNIAIGLTIFTVGLFKKVIIADGFARWGTPVFAAADAGTPVSLLEAWVGVLSYSFQLYFDFSGYSDMAVGLARLFGIRLPVNFYSPYRALNISDFWRRWHMTLSRFLRDYLYIGLGGNRKGPLRRYLNLLLTMVLGGIWHGAGWNFLIWGALHGFYLMVHQLWRALRDRGRGGPAPAGAPGRAFAWLATMLAVMVGWVFFRATSFDGALVLLRGLVGANGCQLPAHYLASLGALGRWLQALDCRPVAELALFHGPLQVLMLGLFAWVVVWWPNTYELMGRYRPVLQDPGRLALGRLRRRWQWRVSPLWAAHTALLWVICLIALGRVSEFIYFQF